MKMTKMALLAGVALAVTAAGAQADELTALKAQIESLNARVATMEAAPALPSGAQLLTISEGALIQTPGLGMTAREHAAYGNMATIISVLPTSDDPDTVISWSGYARAGVVYQDSSVDFTLRVRNTVGGPIDTSTEDSADTDSNDIDVRARGEIRVKASTDTAVGEVGVDIRLRGDFNGVDTTADVYADVAWGYWAMTPELTLGGGYAGSLGNIGYGYDGACSCYYTDNADVALNPGDTTQLRLSYASGPVSFAIALEDGSMKNDDGEGDKVNGDKLGAAGEIKYAGDTFSAEVSGVWRDTDSSTGADALYQIGAGVGLSLGDVASLSVGAALGKGPATVESSDFALNSAGAFSFSRADEQKWWGVSGLASFNLTDEIHAELAAGYKVREGDDFSIADAATWSTDGTEYKTYGILAGIYYQPVDQLTIGVEGEWYTTKTDLDFTSGTSSIELERETDNKSVNLVTVWRF